MFPDDEFGEQNISVMLDGEESEIQFVDHPADEMSVSEKHHQSCIGEEVVTKTYFLFECVDFYQLPIQLVFYAYILFKFLHEKMSKGLKRMFT